VPEICQKLRHASLDAAMRDLGPPQPLTWTDIGQRWMAHRLVRDPRFLHTAEATALTAVLLPSRPPATQRLGFQLWRPGERLRLVPIGRQAGTSAGAYVSRYSSDGRGSNAIKASRCWCRRSHQNTPASIADVMGAAASPGDRLTSSNAAVVPAPARWRFRRNRVAELL